MPGITDSGNRRIISLLKTQRSFRFAKLRPKIRGNSLWPGFTFAPPYFLAWKGSRLMEMNRAGRFAAAVVAVLWALTPAVACFLPVGPVAAEELECCHRMAYGCGSSSMASGHTCCQTSPQPNTTISPVQSLSPTRQVSPVVVPQAIVVSVPAASIARRLTLLAASPSEPTPGCSSILRI